LLIGMTASLILTPVCYDIIESRNRPVSPPEPAQQY
jgi:hypothetical protein